METNLYFVRHAHSVYTPDELNRPLSEKGFQDAKKVTDLLKEEKIDSVISSPYKRAIQTVEGVARYIGKEVIIKEDFRERKLAKVPVENFDEAIAKVWRDIDFAFDGGESNKVAQKRGYDITQKVLQTYKGKNVVIGTHGNIMVLIMNYFDQAYDFSFWKQLAMPDIYQLTFEEQTLKKVQRIWRESEK